ncbi:ion transporter [Alteromonas aestuariivivens]|uniref:Ion transporter n=2 Tax=Alteromonas aestuariivivens TaxID=1938339 RepID=A0A3D8M5A3_9ALTE|nr:ion transporter [Alteromonas aestuariivivens]
MHHNTLRSRVYRILRPYRQYTQGEYISRLFDIMLITLIITNALAMLLMTVEPIHRQYRTQLHQFEVFSVIIFTIEYFARVWTCVEVAPKSSRERTWPNWKRRLRYMVTPIAIVDLLAILPFYLSMFVAVDLRILRLLRLTRLIKLGRYSTSMQTLTQVIRAEARTLLAALSVLMITMIFAATGIYYLEKDVQPQEFSSIPAAMWWAMITLTTVGYGDVVPVTLMGRIFGGLITLLGIGLYALPAGILSSSFTARVHLRQERFREAASSAIADGDLSERDFEHLEKIRGLLDMDQEEAKLIIRLLQHRHSQGETGDTDT